MSPAPESPSSLQRAVRSLRPTHLRATLSSPERIEELRAQVRRLEQTTAELHQQVLAMQRELRRVQESNAALTDLAEANRLQVAEVLANQVASLNRSGGTQPVD